jgi:hypothetical protein
MCGVFELYSRVSIGNCDVSTCFERPNDAVQRERMMQEAKKTTASHAVNVFSTSAVDVPKRESLAAPPKEAPRPELLLSWIKITKQSTMLNRMNSAIAPK